MASSSRVSWSGRDFIQLRAVRDMGGLIIGNFFLPLPSLPLAPSLFFSCMFCASCTYRRDTTVWFGLSVCLVLLWRR